MVNYLVTQKDSSVTHLWVQSQSEPTTDMKENVLHWGDESANMVSDCEQAQTRLLWNRISSG